MNLKKTVIACSIVGLLFSAAQANISVEGFGANVNIFDAKTQYGGGGSLLFDINMDFKAVFRGIYTYYPGNKTVSSKEYDVKYSYATGMFGVEYDPPVDFLSAYRLQWRNSVYCGYSRTAVKVKGLQNAEAADSGFSMALCTGIGYNYTQHIQFFMEGAWHQSFYDGELKNSKIYGAQVLAGIRYSIFDVRNFGDDYE